MYIEVDKITGKGVSIVVREVNTIIKKHRRNIVRIALVYPSIYEASLSSLATHIIYFLGNKYDEVYVERFTVTKLFGKEPLPRSLETKTPLNKFKYIVASIHYEPDYVNLIKILLAAGIEPYRNKRRLHHMVFVGGPAPMANPAPLEDIVDGVFIGEVEVLLPIFIETLLENIDNPKKLIDTLCSREGFYIPDCSEKTRRIWVSNLDETFYPIKQIQSIDKEPVYGRGYIVESARGCPWWCRFCLEGRLFKPYRPRKYSTLKYLVQKGLEVNNLDRVIFYSLYFLGSLDERKILDYLGNQDIKASIPSLRLDVLNDEVLDLIKNIGQKTIVAAPENVSSRVYRAFCKCFRGISSNKDLINTLFNIIDKLFDLKLYFIIGVKGEDMDSVKENIDFIKNVASYARRKGSRITVTINPLIPKPKTPFQWIGMIDLDRARRILKYCVKELSGITDTRPYYANWAWVQASIALGDRSMGKILIEWAVEGGGLGGWRRTIKRNNYSTKYVFTGRSYGEKLPWDKIVIGEYVEEVCEKEYIVLKKILLN